VAESSESAGGGEVRPPKSDDAEIAAVPQAETGDAAEAAPPAEPSEAETAASLPAQPGDTEQLPAQATEADVDRMQAELAELRERTERLQAEHDASWPVKLRHIGRSVGSAVLIILGVLCLVLSPVAIWGRNLILNTDRYVETVTPLADDTGVQNAVIAAVDRQVQDHLDVKSLVAEVLPPRAAQALGGALEGAVNSLVNNITTNFVRSDKFHNLWVTVNKVGHQQITYLLTGKTPPNSGIKLNNNGVVTLDLSVVVNAVKQQLVDRGLTIASKVPAVGATIEIAHAKGLVQAQKAVRALNTAANWLPWIGFLLVGGGIAAARRRRRAGLRAALGLAAGMVVIGIVLLIGRNIYLDAIPTSKLPRDTAEFIFDTLVRFLRLGIRIILAVALLIALIIWLFGPSRPAVAFRRAVGNAPKWVGRKVSDTAVAPAIVQYATPIRVGVVALALLFIVLWDRITLARVLILAIVVAIILMLIQAVITAARQRPAQAPPAPTGA
jgi:LPXTG-motif cell wall-anchored protein